jgi:hypothetical protein
MLDNSELRGRQIKARREWISILCSTAALCSTPSPAVLLTARMCSTPSPAVLLTARMCSVCALHTRRCCDVAPRSLLSPQLTGHAQAHQRPGAEERPWPWAWARFLWRAARSWWLLWWRVWLRRIRWIRVGQRQQQVQSLVLWQSSSWGSRAVEVVQRRSQQQRQQQQQLTDITSA